MRALLLIRAAPHYRRDAFERGLAAAGFTVAPGNWKPTPDDVVVIWNRYGSTHSEAMRFENAGAKVLVAENALVGTANYTLSLNYHNGAGWWHVGTEARPQGIALKPWRAKGSKILVLPQRGFGAPGVTQPDGWADDVVRRLRKITDRPIEVRPHPGNVVPKPEPDWRDVHAVVTWGSGAGIKALVNGVPCFHEMPRWVGAPAARFGIDRIEHPWIGDRGPMLHRLSWLQWSVDEIAAGVPFRHLLCVPRQAEIAAAE